MSKPANPKLKAITNLKSYGYVVPEIAEIYNYEGFTGMKVGAYQHNCEIENSDITVLLISLDRNVRVAPRIKEFWGNGVKL